MFVALCSAWFCSLINNFFSFILFSAVIYKRRGMKMVSKIIKYKLDSSSKMQFVFSPKTFKKIFWKTIDFLKNLEMTQTTGGGESCSLHHYDAVRTKINMWFTIKTTGFRSKKYIWELYFFFLFFFFFFFFFLRIIFEIIFIFLLWNKNFKWIGSAKARLL